MEDQRLVLYLQEYNLLVDQRDYVKESLAEIEGKVRRYEEDLIPDLLAEYGVESVTAEDGTKVSIKNILTAKVADRDHNRALEILKRIGAGNIAQTAATLSFVEDEDHLLSALHVWAEEHGIVFGEKSVINPATLKSIVNRALEAGELQPSELGPLGVYLMRKAVVKAPR